MRWSSRSCISRNAPCSIPAQRKPPTRCPQRCHGLSVCAIATPDGETLAALHVPAGKGRPTVLLFPGNGDNIVDYGFLGELLSAHGYGLLAVSYRGYPGSTGSPTETGLLADGLAAFDWLSAQDRSSPIVILGRSLGTGVAVNTAAEREADSGRAGLRLRVRSWRWRAANISTSLSQR